MESGFSLMTLLIAIVGSLGGGAALPSLGRLLAGLLTPKNDALARTQVIGGASTGTEAIFASIIDKLIDTSHRERSQPFILPGEKQESVEEVFDRLLNERLGASKPRQT